MRKPRRLGLGEPAEHVVAPRGGPLPRWLADADTETNEIVGAERRDQRKDAVVSGA